MEKFNEIVSKYTPYLEDIRKRLYVSAVLFVIFFAVGFFSTATILKLLLSFFNLSDVVIATTSPFQFADLSINIGLLSAFSLSCPVIAYHAFSFLRPALTKKEKKLFVSLIPIAVILFIIGFIYGFFILYYALIVLAQLNVSIGIENIWDIGMFMSQILLTSTLLGALFEFPIIMTVIMRMGILRPEMLKNKRKIAVFCIFIFTTLLPPTDGLSLIAMALPLIVLYEVTIFINTKVFRPKGEILPI